MKLVPHTIRSKPQVSSARNSTIRVPDWVSLFDRPDKHNAEEDPYSVPANGSSYDSSYYANKGTLLKRSTIKEPKPPKLPPRDFGKFKSTNKSNAKNTIKKNKFDIPTPDYSQEEDFYTISEKNMKKIPFCERGIYNRREQRKSDILNRVCNAGEDPYYSGMRARVTSFPKSLNTKSPSDSKKSVAWRQMRKVFSSGYINTLIPPLTKKKRSKSSYYSNYNSSESDPYASLNDTIYEPIYGRLGYSGSKYCPSTVRSKAYVSQWDNHY